MLRVHNPNLASSCRQGERCTKDTDHQVVHSVVHLANHRKYERTEEFRNGGMQNLGAAWREAWAGATP